MAAHDLLYATNLPMHELLIYAEKLNMVKQALSAIMMTPEDRTKFHQMLVVLSEIVHLGCAPFNEEGKAAVEEWKIVFRRLEEG